MKRVRPVVWVGAILLLAAVVAPVSAQQAAGTVSLLQPVQAAAGGGGSTAATAASTAQMEKEAAGDVVIPVKPAGKETITIKGFISTTFFAQDQNFAFGNGQNAQWPTAPEYTDNKWFNGGDVRNTRLTLDFNGPDIANGWKVGAGLEADFFGGFNRTGAFSQQQATPRLRLAYADMKKGNTTVRIGQFWSPLFGEVPASLSHIAFPLGYGSAGMVGWRFPGVFLYQNLGAPGAKTTKQLVVAIFEGSWNGPGSPIANQSAGNVSFRNQVEARFNLGGHAGGGAWKLYVVGHWDDKDLTGVNNVAPDAKPKTLTGTAAELGGSYSIGSFLIHGNVYTSKAAGQQFAAITQFGDIKDWGGWLQLGYHIDKAWSIYGFYGMVDPNDKDVMEWVGSGGRIKNEQAAAMLEWSAGPYQLGIEWLHDKVTMATNTAIKGNQIALSARYVF